MYYSVWKMSCEIQNEMEIKVPHFTYITALCDLFQHYKLLNTKAD